MRWPERYRWLCPTCSHHLLSLPDADSSKLDLSKDLAHDFPDPFHSLIDLQLISDDFVS